MFHPPVGHSWRRVEVLHPILPLPVPHFVRNWVTVAVYLVDDAAREIVVLFPDYALARLQSRNAIAMFSIATRAIQRPVCLQNIPT